MNKLKRGKLARERMALLAIVSQLAASSMVAAAFADQQPLLNTTLPLPELTTSQIERSLKSAGACISSVAAQQEQSKSKPVVKAEPALAHKTALPAPTIFINAETAKPAEAEALSPVVKIKTMPRLEAPSSWLEDALSEKSAPASAPMQPAPPAAEPAPAQPNVTAYPTAQPAVLQSGQASTEATPAELRGPIERVASPTPATAPTAEAAARSADQSASPLVNESNTASGGSAGDQNNATPTLLSMVPPSPASTLASPEQASQKLIFIDNDEAIEQEASIKYEDLPTDVGGTKVRVGAHFPIVIVSEITSKTAKVGDPVQGRLKYDLKVGNRLVAQRGATVLGHINYCLPARTPMRSLVSTNRWYRNSGCLGITFDEIVTAQGEHIPLVAEPARQAIYVKNKGEGRELGINHKGQIAGPWSKQLEYKAVRIGLNAAFSATGAFSFGAMPVALGVIGAVNPSFAFMKPVGTNVRHRRIKGFFWGALSGVPGSWLIEDTTIKGQEAVIKPGDEFLAEMRKEFTGEPETEAELAGANTKVHGEVVGRHGAKKKKS